MDDAAWDALPDELRVVSRSDEAGVTDFCAEGAARLLEIDADIAERNPLVEERLLRRLIQGTKALSQMGRTCEDLGVASGAALCHREVPHLHLRRSCTRYVSDFGGKLFLGAGNARTG